MRDRAKHASEATAKQAPRAPRNRSANRHNPLLEPVPLRIAKLYARIASMDPAIYALLLGILGLVVYQIVTRRKDQRFKNTKSVEERDALAQQLIEEELRRKVG